MIFEGVVVKGAQVAKEKFGLPTANIWVDTTAEEGVFVGEVVINAQSYPALVFIGTPSLNSESTKRAEVHAFNYAGLDFYGEAIKISPSEKLRDNQNFKDWEEAKLVIAQDIKTAKLLLNL